MRDLQPAELSSVYGAGGYSKKCKPVRYKCGKRKGGSGSGSGGGHRKGKGGSS